jgi:APA family basic amino acid/polyamine antiporter
VALLGAVICTGMIVAIDTRTLMVAMIWMVVGLIVYFLYSRHHSTLRKFSDVLPTADDFEKRS